MYLHELWKFAWTDLGIRFDYAEQEGLFDKMIVRYDEPHRYYHTRKHILDCIESWEQVYEVELKHPHAVALALYYHDVVYDTHRGDNEDRSADLFAHHAASLGLASLHIERIIQMILATKNHDSDDSDTRVLLDIDLSILGADSDAFWQFEAQIRREYFWVPEALYRAERAKIMRGFLASEPLFHTTYFRDRLESQAKANLKALITSLT